MGCEASSELATRRRAPRTRLAGHLARGAPAPARGEHESGSSNGRKSSCASLGRGGVGSGFWGRCGKGNWRSCALAVPHVAESFSSWDYVGGCGRTVVGGSGFAAPLLAAAAHWRLRIGPPSPSAAARANADLESIHEHLARLQGGVSPISRVLSRETHVHEILTRDPRIGRLVAMDHFAELRHGPGHPDAAVLRHNARRDPHERRHRLSSGRRAAARHGPWDAAW
eukprot:CAMPEP_0117595910 /NCGR_PEP_ID=MMETSP0784-20121206/74019_1 /TAXON_ID=39447 /ORGANISM="" /LENGTH=225 /DNA_ID=CAMNT_0005398133 /DNA_START=144 /DNA_END=822 /DNA_ORIENTATION=+